jgi:tRNA(Ile)-lysidine synthase
MPMIVPAFALAFRAGFPDLLGRPLVVALSGGADSVALLLLLHRNHEALRCGIRAVHVHHHARGAEADGDAEHCAALCRTLGVPFVLAHLAEPPPSGQSAEAWWRSGRYACLEAARRQLEAAAVATGHTLDDQAETVLLKLLRGSGPRGVAAVRARHGAVIRPLLSFRRKELRDWLATEGVGWREDTSNADRGRPRAWVRHELLPLLLARSPRATEHLAAFAAALAEDEAALGGWLRREARWPEVADPVPAAAVAELPPALRRRWLLELAARLPLGEPPSRRQLEQFDGLLDQGRPTAVDLGRRWVLRRRGAQLVLSPPPCRPFDPVTAAVPSELTLPGGFVARLGFGSAAAGHRALLAPRLRDVPLAWRSVRPGERAAGRDARPLSVRLAAAGIPAEWRRAWPVLEAGGTIAWLPGVGVQPGWDAPPAAAVVAELEEPWVRRARS